MSSPKQRADVLHRQLMLQTVERARQLITDPKHWTQETLARGSWGLPRSAFSKRAVRFCHNGALTRAAYELTGKKSQAYKITQEIITMQMETLTEGGRPATINDCRYRPHERVLALLDKTAAHLRS